MTFSLMNKRIHSLVLLMCLGSFNAALAAIYKTVDAEGHVTYSNMPSKGAAKLDIEGAAPAAPDKMERASRVKTPTPVNFPRIDSQTQGKRDDKRKQILASELDSEQKALQEAKKAYADSIPQGVANGKIDPSMRPDERLQRLQADVHSHEKNVQLLEKELRLVK